MTDLAATLSEYEGRDVRRPSALHRVWDVREPGLLSRHRKARQAQVADCRRAVWRQLLELRPSLFIYHLESPAEYEVRGSWQAEGRLTWRVPPTFDPLDNDTLAWLSVGGWMAYASAQPLANIESLFRTAPEGITAWAAIHQVEVAVDSDLDDLEWRVFVHEDGS